jgi:hypothetical protein
VINTRKHVGHSKAFEPKYYGSFRVVRAVNEVDFEITTLDKSKSEVVHFNRLKRYILRENDKRTSASKTALKTPTPSFIKENTIFAAMLVNMLLKLAGDGGPHEPAMDIRLPGGAFIVIGAASLPTTTSSPAAQLINVQELSSGV